MKIVVAGATGSIGLHVVNTAIEMGHHPVVPIRNKRKFSCFLRDRIPGGKRARASKTYQRVLLIAPLIQKRRDIITTHREDTSFSGHLFLLFFADFFVIG